MTTQRCHTRHPFAATGLVAALLGLAGCGGGGTEGPPPLYPVTGKVTFDGNPVTVGTVTFEPDEAKGNKSKYTAAGMIDSSGSYKLATGTQEGAPLGWYKVSVSPHGMPSGGMGGPGDGSVPKGAAIPPKYQSTGASGIRIEVVEKPAPGAYDIALSKK